jgi:hypothetical protein
LTRVYGLPQDSSGTPSPPEMFNAMNGSTSCSSSSSRYDLEVSLDQIRIIGLNPVTVLKRDAPTLYLSMTVQHSLASSSSPSFTDSSSTTSSSSHLILSLQYSAPTSSWILEDKSLHFHHLFSLTDTYSHCLLSCELWYKSLIRRKKKHVGSVQCPLGGIDTNETKMTKPIDASLASEDLKERLTKEGGEGIRVNISMRLKQK